MSVLTYGLLIPGLGFYWDDLPMIWLVNTEGIDALGSYTAIDRISLGFVYALGFTLFNTNPLGWHLARLLLRVLGGLVLLWGIRKLWPNCHFGTTMMALLFVIYPGFSQQSNA